MEKNKLLSVISPVYKAANIVPELVSQLHNQLQLITENYEIILVNDASPDDSWPKISIECEKDSRVVGLNLSRNFGQHYAITAGLEHAKGEWIVVMDCDLQDRPDEIINLYNKAMEGYDLVLARRANRKDNYFKKLGSKLFYKLFSYLTDTTQDNTVANFGIYNKKVIESIISMGDYYRVFPILIQWVGFNKYYLNVQHSFRAEGKSSYSRMKLINLAFNMIISFSDKPLRLGLKLGVLVSFSSLLLSIYYFILYMTGRILVPGYASLVILITFSTGIIITFLGLVGSYIGKLSLQVKNRPKYIIKDKINS